MTAICVTLLLEKTFDFGGSPCRLLNHPCNPLSRVGLWGLKIVRLASSVTCPTTAAPPRY